MTWIAIIEFIIMIVIIIVFRLFVLFVKNRIKQNLRDKKMCSFYQKLYWYSANGKGFLFDELDKFDCNRVIIYGAGVIGKDISDVLEKSGKEVVGYIDRRPIDLFNDRPVFHSIEDCPNADAIIVTPLNDGYKILAELSERTDIKLLCLNDFI